MIVTDCTSSCTSNYHTITTTAAPSYLKRKVSFIDNICGEIYLCGSENISLTYLVNMFLWILFMQYFYPAYYNFVNFVLFEKYCCSYGEFSMILFLGELYSIQLYVITSVSGFWAVFYEYTTNNVCQ